MTHSIKQQLAADLKKVKTQSGDRVQRIKTIVKTAFNDAVAEVKGGTQEAKNTSKESLNNVIRTMAPSDPAQAVVTITATEDSPTPFPQESDGSEVFTTEAASAATPEAKIEPSTATVVQALLKAAGLKAKSLAGQQYSKLKQELPARLEQAKGKTAAWDKQLSDRYGDDYTSIKQHLSKAIAWYQAKLEEGKAIDAQPLERKQSQKAEALSDLGVKVAQKEEEVKQQIGQALRTITVNAQS